MTPEEWAWQLVIVPLHPSGDAQFILPDGRTVWLDDAPLPESSVELGRLARSAVARVIRLAVAEALNAGMPGVPLSEGELEAIRQRAEKATAGPWVYMGDDPTFAGQVRSVANLEDGGFQHIVDTPHLDDRPEDMTFIAESRSDIPALLAHIDHMNALFRDMTDTGEAGAYRRGYADGLVAAEKTG